MTGKAGRRTNTAAAGRAATLAWRSAPAHLLGYVASTVAGAAAPVLVAWLTKLALDRVVTPGPLNAVLGLAVGLALVGTVNAGLPELGQYLQAELDRRVSVRAKSELFGAVARLPGLARFEDPRFLDRLRLAQQNAANPDRLIGSALASARSALTVIGFVTALAAVSWVFAVVVAVAAVPALVVELRLSRQRISMMWRIGPVERRELFYAGLLSTVDAAKEIRLFDLGRFLRDRMLTEARAANAERRRVDRRELSRHAFLTLTAAAVAGAALIWALLAAARGRLGVGDVAMFTAAIAGVQSGIHQLIGGGVMTREHLRTFGYYLDIVDTAPDLAVPVGSRELVPLRSGIRLHDVWFRYSDEHPWVLRGVTMTVPHGRTVALVGANGAGKSTLIKLLCRFYDPTRGRITWDGVDLRDVTPDALRARIGVVFQDFVGYEFTAADNIAVGDLTATDDRSRIEEAARNAGLHDTLAGLPRGYDTMLTRSFGSETDEGETDAHTGVVLSGGQWQRVAIARAFLRRDRDLMILDEPSSGLDAAAEHDLHTRLRAIRSDRTGLLVSHRLGAVRTADRIVVLADGRVAEEGGHAELLAAGGRYAHLFTLQAAGYRDGEPAPGVTEAVTAAVP